MFSGVESCAASRLLDQTLHSLDRVADLGCALGAVVTVLYHGAGLPGAQVIARTRETFRPGETVRNWWNRASAGSADARGKW